MKKAIIRLRRWPVFNSIVRSILRTAAIKLPQKINRSVISRWPVSGVVKLNLFDEVELNLKTKADDNLANVLFYEPSSYQEINELLLFKELAKRSKVIFDIGANTGLFTIVSSIVSKSSAIYSFEPYTPNVKRLGQNIKLNNCQNVTIVAKALGSSKGTVSFSVPASGQISDVVSADRSFTESFYSSEIVYKREEISVITLDDFVAQEQIQFVNLIKLDVENYEMEVLKGSFLTIDKSRPVIIAEIFVNEERIKFFSSLMQRYDYSCYIIMKEGLIKSDRLVPNPDCRNFVFTKLSEPQFYYSFSHINSWINEF